MKKTFFSYFAPLTVLLLQLTVSNDNCSKKSVNQPALDDSTFLLKVKQLDIKKYLDLPIDSFMKTELISQYTTYRFIDEPPGNLSYLFLRYSDNIHINILVKEFKYVTQYNTKLDWKLEDFKKEKAGIISVFNGRKLVEEVGGARVFAN
jgi:hypothetical protein